MECGSAIRIDTLLLFAARGVISLTGLGDQETDYICEAKTIL
jgi:hypothetical protein